MKMDSFKFHDMIQVEKANAISRYRRIQRITTLFRFVELFLFLIIASRFSTQFAFPLSTEYFRGISVTLVSPRFVFVLGNVIVVALFFISGRFSPKNGAKRNDFYDQYVEQCRKNQGICRREKQNAANEYKYGFREEKNATNACRQSVCFSAERKIKRSQSENPLRKLQVEEQRERGFRRSMTEKSLRAIESERKPAATRSCSYKEDEMSGDEFRRTVEAFIARQQRFLREEDDYSSALFSCET